MNKEYLLIRDFSSVCFKLLKRDKSLIIIMLIYGIIASAFNILLPLSIQYVASQISTNASIFPVITIIFCLLIFLTFYAALKIVQIVAFSYFEKRFFITNVALMAMHNDNEDEDRSNYIQSYTEISNIIKYVGNFLFSTSLLIQQILIGLILTAFYHISFLVFNIILLAIIYAIFKLYFLRSVILYKKEIDVKYKIGNALCEIYVDRRTKINSLLTEYYAQKNKYFAIILQQNVIFFLLYAIANTIFLSLCSILTFKGYLTIPQFLASEIIFSLIFMNLGEFTKNLKNIYELLNSSHKLAFFANGNTDLGIFPIMTKYPYLVFIKNCFVLSYSF